MTLAFIDTETTGLDPRINQPYEVCIWLEKDDGTMYPEFPAVFDLPHTLEYANTTGLTISRYFERGFRPFSPTPLTESEKNTLTRMLNGATLVGSNPSFDANMMQRYLGVAVWHHRFIDVACMAMTVFDWDTPKGLFDVVKHLNGLGYTIGDPDHSAEGDVRATREVYKALREIQRAQIEKAARLDSITREIDAILG